MLCRDSPLPAPWSVDELDAYYAKATPVSKDGASGAKPTHAVAAGAGTWDLPRRTRPPLSRFPCLVEALRTRNSCHRLYNCPRRTMDSFARRRVLHCRRLPRKSRRSLGRILWSPPNIAVVLRYKRLSPCFISSPRDKARRAMSYFEDEPDRRTDCGQYRETAGANCGRRAPPGRHTMTAIIQATIVLGALATENLRHQYRSRWRPPPQRVLLSPDLTAAACALAGGRPSGGR